MILHQPVIFSFSIARFGMCSFLYYLSVFQHYNFIGSLRYLTCVLLPLLFCKEVFYLKFLPLNICKLSIKFSIGNTFDCPSLLYKMQLKDTFTFATGRPCVSVYVSTLVMVKLLPVWSPS